MMDEVAHGRDASGNTESFGPQVIEVSATAEMVCQQSTEALGDAETIDQEGRGGAVSADSLYQQVYQVAQDLFRKRVDWVTFYREVLGPRGIVRRCFSTRKQLATFKQTETYRDIQWMLCQLRRMAGDIPPRKEPTGVITIRVPKSLHEALRTEAYERRTSINKLCISKLLQFIDQELVPSNAPEEEGLGEKDSKAGL